MDISVFHIGKEEVYAEIADYPRDRFFVRSLVHADSRRPFRIDVYFGNTPAFDRATVIFPTEVDAQQFVDALGE